MASVATWVLAAAFRTRPAKGGAGAGRHDGSWARASIRAPAAIHHGQAARPQCQDSGQLTAAGLGGEAGGRGGGCAVRGARRARARHYRAQKRCMNTGTRGEEVVRSEREAGEPTRALLHPPSSDRAPPSPASRNCATRSLQHVLRDSLERWVLVAIFRGAGGRGRERRSTHRGRTVG